MPAKVKVAEVMKTTLHVVDGLISVQTAINEMNRLHVGSLIVQRRDEEDEFGIITVHDIAEKVIAVNRSVERTNVYEVMTKPALSIDADMNIKYAIRLLSRLGLTRALVTGGPEPLGLVTLRDMIVRYSDTDEA